MPMPMARHGRQQLYTGIPVAPGVVVGRVYAPSAHVSLDAVPDRAAGDLEEPPEQTILLGRSMGLTCIAGVPIARLAGLVCTGGSPLSHGVIVARALGIPAVIGVAGLIPGQCNGREIVLDGYRGRVILDPAPEVRAEFHRLQRQEAELTSGLDALRDLPAETPDGRQVSLEANITLLNEVRLAKERGAEGVGLYRSELPFLMRDTLRRGYLPSGL